MKMAEKETEQHKKLLHRERKLYPQTNYDDHRVLYDEETRKLISTSLNVQLHKAENPWKPTYKQETIMDEKEVFRRNVRSILNKITPQKFETLLVQLKHLNIDTIYKLNVVTELVYDHAIQSITANLAVVYANVAKHLALIKVPNGNNKKINLRKFVLTKCHEVFENDGSNEMKLIEMEKEEASPPDVVDTTMLSPAQAIENYVCGYSGETKSTNVVSKYSALTDSCESSPGRSIQIPPAITNSPSTSKERDSYDTEFLKGIVTKIAEMKKTADPHVIDKTADLAELKLEGSFLTDEQMEQETNQLIDEFLHDNDFEKAVNSIIKLASPSTIHVLINSAIHQVLERSSKARHSVGLLLFSLVKQNVIRLEHYKKGFACVLEYIDEFALDVPLIWEYLGEILESVLKDDKHAMIILKDVIQPCIPSETAGMLMSATLHCAARERGIIKVRELWRDSNLQWTDILGPKIDVQEFIMKHKLGYYISSSKSKLSAPMSKEEIQTHLLSLIEKTEKNGEIFDRTNASFSVNTEKGFILDLASAVLQNATKGVLRTIFNILHDDDVLSEESFKNWEKSDDVAELERKLISLYSVKSFFTWLKEEDSKDSVTEEGKLY